MTSGLLRFRGALYRLANWPELVQRVIDTATWDDIPGIGRIDDGVLTSYHVSDEPEKVLAFLKRRGNLVAAYGPKGEHAELGPGLYLSGNPDFWVNRHRGKWGFLQTLTDPQKQLLGRHLMQEVEELKAQHYLSNTEYEYAIRTVSRVLDGTYTNDLLTTLAGQPYNIRFWKPEYLESLGIDPGLKPRAVKVRLSGRLAQLRSSHHEPALFRQLRHTGVVGAFTVASFSSNPELVLWDSGAVRDARIVDVG